MQRYFSENKIDDRFILSKDDSYHINKVMRMNLSDLIEVVFNEKVYICEIIKLLEMVEAKIIEEENEINELNYNITIVQSLVKEQKMDYIIQKTTELGVSEIIPFDAERSIVKLDKKEDKKIERYQKIAKEAAEQSKRVKIPKVSNVYSLSNLVKLIDFDTKFLCTVNEKSKNLKKVLSNLDTNAKMLFVIGPEGGFTEKEENTLMDNGFIPISLGSSVLRTETASTFIMSVVRYLDMR